MTYGDSGPGNPPEPSEPTPAASPPAPPAAPSPVSKLSTGEMIIALGALVIAGLVDLIGNVLLDEWGVSFVILAFAYLALALIFLHHFRDQDTFAPYDKLLVFTGYATGVFGVREVLDVLDSGFPDEAIGALFELAVIVGCGLMAAGAYLFSKSE
ncbi:MAG TPA: hypothetical protein VJA46_05275 [Acidimicrobiia bacterium]|nr:hypothetical protein [Acidimicrobiia bacterium]